ncbi:MAG: Ig-like domain-containing protein [Verrucomicrobiota bacterium]
MVDAEDIFADFMNYPHHPVIITLTDGSYVTVNSDGEVWQNLLDADGVPIGNITQVNSVSGGLQFGATAAALDDGGYVVAWSSNDYATEDYSGFGVLLQRYASNGTAIGSPVQVNTSTTGNQNFPDVTSLSDGGYVVVWADDGADGSGWGIQGQRYDSDGREVAGEFRINTEGSDSQWMPKVVGLDDGGFVVAWNSHSQDGVGWGVYSQRYDSNGSTVGGETLVNETTDRGQVAPSIASLASGGYVVTWYDDAADGDDFGVMARMYDATGTPGSEFIVNTSIEGPQLAPVVHGLDNGGFVIAWQGADEREDFTHVYAQRYDEFGNANGDAEVVNSNLQGNNFHPDVTVGANGDIIFAYYYHGAQGGHQLQTRIWEVNAPPTAIADSSSVSENATEALTGNVLTNDTDPTNDTLSVTRVSGLDTNVGLEIQGTYGSLTIQADGSYAYTVDGAMAEVNSMTDGDSLSETFSYEMSDGQSFSSANLQVTINGVNDAPEAGVEISTTAEEFGAFIDLLTNDTDPENDGPLTITEIDQQDAVEGSPVILENGSMVTLQEGGTVFFDPNGEFDYLEEGETATTTFDYTVEDSTGQASEQTVTVNIQGGDSDPVPKAWLSQSQTFYEIGVDPATESVIFTEIAAHSNPVNALAYNDNNGILYAADRTDHTLISIDPNTGAISVVADLSSYGGGGGYRGDIDPATNTWYFIADSNTLYALDLDNPSVPATAIGSYSGGADFAFDPLTGLLWSVYSGGTAVRTINPVTGEQQSIGTGNGLPSGTYGGMYADDQGNLVAVNNNGGLYSIDKSTGDAFYIADSSPSNQNDAASPHYGTLVTSLPYLFLDADASSGAAGTSFYTQYNKGGAGANVVDSDVNIFDFDSTVFSSAKIRLLNTYSGDTLTVGSLPGTIRAVVSTNVDGELEVNFSGTGSDADWEAALYAVTYINDAVTTDVTPRVFEVTLIDAEGNSSLRARSTVMVSLSTPPVAIDLDGDGVEYLGVEEGVQLDVDGDGLREQSAWVAPDDAILIYDRDNDGDISGREEYAFADYGSPGATDLEGLRAGFDTDDDLMLTANDAEFEAFKLWQDGNADGAVDEGELRSLTEAGVESIGLRSDGVSYRAANGDVLVHGEAEVNFADGSQGIAADASFDFQELVDEDNQPLEIITNAGEVVNLDETSEPTLTDSAAAVEDPVGDEQSVSPAPVSATLEAEAAVVAASI